MDVYKICNEGVCFNVLIFLEWKLACEYDQMHFTIILEEIKSTLPKSLFYSYYSTNQIKSNQMLVFDERGKLEYPGKNLSE